MRISTKGRYGMAVMICLAEKKDRSQTVADISQKLDVSKIYLEQVFALLKNAGLIQSIKGAQGGYFLSGTPQGVTAYDILRATEPALFEPTEKSFSGAAEAVETALQNWVWSPLSGEIAKTLSAVTLQDLLEKSKKEYMFYI